LREPALSPSQPDEVCGPVTHGWMIPLTVSSVNPYPVSVTREVEGSTGGLGRMGS
jgi:hypothetical protein